MRNISIIIPAYNEAAALPQLHVRLGEALAPLRATYACELIFVDDGSTDATASVIESICAADPDARFIELSRNFGKEIAVSAGLQHAHGDAAIILDADLQHPPQLIPTFVQLWEKGADTVIGVREKNAQEGLVKRAGSDLFYKIMNRIGSTKITPYATDFRLVDRKMIDAFNSFTERNRMTRGLFDWMGFKKEYVSFVAPPRMDGDARYRTGQLFRLAMTSFVTHSLLPLKLAGYAGVIITTCAGVLGLFVLIEQVVLNDPLGFNFSGAAMLAVFTLFLVGIVLSCLGLIALYIANIHSEVVNRPLYVIRKKNVDSPKTRSV